MLLSDLENTVCLFFLNWLQRIPSWDVARAGMKYKPINSALWDLL